MHHHPARTFIHFIPGFPLLRAALYNYCLLLLVAEQLHTVVACLQLLSILHNIQHHPTQAETASPQHPTHSVVPAAQASE